MRSLVIALIITGSAAIFAVSTGFAACLPVTVPRVPAGLILGVTGYSLKPAATNGDLDFATSGYLPELVTIKPRYDLGWGINLGYIFCNASDINLSYFHLETRHRNFVVTCPDGLNSIVPIANIFNFPLADPAIMNPVYNNAAWARAQYSINQLGLAGGQVINVGCRFNIHPFIGIRGLHFRRDLDTCFTESGAVIPTTMIIQTQNTTFAADSRFDGIGPLAGMDANYCLGCGLGLVGHFDTALLVGNLRDSVDETAQQTITVPDTVTDTVVDAFHFPTDNKHRVVPIIDLKLGAAYTWVFHGCCCSYSRLTLEAGWTCNYYFNVVDRIQTLSFMQNAGQGGNINPIIAPGAVTGCSAASVSFNGPYLSLIFHV